MSSFSKTYCTFRFRVLQWVPALPPTMLTFFLGLWEKNFVYCNSYSDKIKWWGRYIDDIFLIWSGSYEELLQFYDHLNNNDRNVKLCMEHSKTTINFLELTIFKGKDGKLHTTVYRKTTDRNTMLKADRFHPNLLKKNYTFWPVPTYLK